MESVTKAQETEQKENAAEETENFQAFINAMARVIEKYGNRVLKEAADVV